MQYISNTSLDPRFNLALEEYVVKYLEPDDRFVLLWQNEPSVIIGRFQNTVEEINIDYIKQNNINVVRRITGGGAVYHDLGNLNFSFIEKAASQDIDFRKYNERIIKALEKLGVRAEHNSRNDIAIDGKKFSGNAQYIYKGKVLHHGTILFNSNLKDVQAALNVNPDKFTSKSIKSVRSRVTNVIDYLQDKISIQEFKEVLLKTLFDEKPIIEYKLDKHDFEIIDKLVKEKYSTWDWNFGFSPTFNFNKNQRFTCGKIDIRLYVDKGIIKDVKIFGDFFSNEDITNFEQFITGSRYDEDQLKERLGEINLEKFFGPVTLKEILSLFF